MISLYVQAVDLPEFHAGKEVKAIPDNRSAIALERTARDTNPLVNVLVTYDEIVSTETHEERGMVRGNFLYYMIQKKV